MNESDNWIPTLPFLELNDSKPLEVLVGDILLFLVLHDGNIKAFQGLCPHQAARLGQGQVVDGQVHCPHHRARFSLEDGSCSPGWDLPALTNYPAQLRDGIVHVNIGASLPGSD